MSSFPFLFTVEPTPKPSKGALGAGAIAGIVVGVVGFVFILVPIAYCCVRHFRNRTREREPGNTTNCKYYVLLDFMLLFFCDLTPTEKSIFCTKYSELVILKIQVVEKRQNSTCLHLTQS